MITGRIGLDNFSLRSRISVAALLATLAVLTIGVSDSKAAISGQLEAWNVRFGTDPGQLYNPRELGVDPVDGSVYILNESFESPEARIEKFSPTGELKGEISIPRALKSGGSEFRPGFVGIAVDHSRERFYLVEAEYEINSFEDTTATNVLAFSTEPQGGHLVQDTAATIELPAPDGTEAILAPQEIRVDPTDGDLILSGLDTAGEAILQRIEPDGALGNRYVESGSLFGVPPGTYKAELPFAIEVGADGTTYVVANSGDEFNVEIGAFTLPPNFEADGKVVTAATPLPGFEEAGSVELWRTNAFGLLIKAPNLFGEGTGPQLAITKGLDGEETLIWKAGALQQEKDEEFIHGYSLQQRATTVVWGGGPAEGECSIESRTAALAGAPDGSLLVLDQGQEVENASQAPSFGPNVMRFGPGGSKCPTPAAAIATEDPAGQAATSVPAGTRVTLDASGSELGRQIEHPGHENTLEGVTWIVKAPDGSEEAIDAPGTSPALKLGNYLTEEGQYTFSVKLKIGTLGNLSRVGGTFTAKPEKLDVTAPSGPAPIVTSVSPATGSATGGTTLTIEGTGLEAATAVQLGLVDVAVTEDTATKIVATTPPGTAGEKVGVFVTTAAGTSVESAAAEYEYVGAPAPTVTAISPTHGPAAGGNAITIEGTGLEAASAVRFGAATATITADTGTTITATAPEGAPGKVAVTVTTPGGTSAGGPQYTYDPIPTHALTVTTAGNGTGKVTCNGTACLTSYPAGTTVTLAATPEGASTFAGWGGACSGTGGCTVKLVADTSVTATFDPPAAQGGGDTGGGSSGGGQSGGGTPGGGGSSGGGETKAQKLAEQRKKALKKCTKLHGTAKTQCVKKAHQIGKKKPKTGKKGA